MNENMSPSVQEGVLEENEPRVLDPNNPEDREILDRHHEELLVEHYGGSRISLETLEFKCIELFNLLKQVLIFKSDRNRVLIINKPRERADYHIFLFTSAYEYRISVRTPKSDQDKGYLGCGVSSRMPRAGEWHTRGNDLPDGEFSEETWEDIIFRIVNYELTQVRV